MLLRRGVYPYEFMNDWEHFNEKSLTEKKNFVETWIKNSDCNYAKRICEDFEIKNLGDYHGLDLNGNILSLADVFDNFWKLCLEIYE